MTPHEHRREAERFLAVADRNQRRRESDIDRRMNGVDAWQLSTEWDARCADDPTWRLSWAEAVAAAHVHALLATLPAETTVDLSGTAF